MFKVEYEVSEYGKEIEKGILEAETLQEIMKLISSTQTYSHNFIEANPANTDEFIFALSKLNERKVNFKLIT